MTDPVRDYFDRTAAEFDAIHDRAGASPGTLVDRVFRPGMRERYNYVLTRTRPDNRSLLDVGCGGGKYAVAFAARGLAVTGIDFAPGMIELARRRAVAAGVADRCRWLAGDVLAAPLTEEPVSPLEQEVPLRRPPLTEEPVSPPEQEVPLRRPPLTEEPVSPLEQEVPLRRPPLTEEPVSPLEQEVPLRRPPVEPADLVLAIGVFDYVRDPAPLLARLKDLARRELVASFPRAGTWQGLLRRAWLLARGCPVRYYRVAEVRGLTAAWNGTVTVVESIRGDYLLHWTR